MKRLLIAAMCLSLSGCFAFVLPIPDVTEVPASSAEFDKYVASVNALPPINAVAVAKDPTRWSVGSAQKGPTVEDAKTRALIECASAAIKDGVKAICKIYSVNGIVVAN